MNGGTLRALASRQLEALARSYGVTSVPQALFELLFESVGERRLDERPRWSGFTNDCSPFEPSVVFGGRPELRFLVESQGDPASPSSYWDAAMRLNERIVALPGVDLTRFEAVRELFRPTDPQAVFAAAHAVVLRQGGPPAFKLYVAPLAHGVERARATVDEAMARLGHGSAWRRTCARLRDDDQLVIFSLDLAGGPHARAKVYVRPRSTTREALERAGDATELERADLRRCYEALLGDPDGAWPRRLYVCHQYADPRAERAGRLVLHAPMWPGLGDDDAVRARIVRLFEATGLDPTPFLRVHAAMSEVTDEGGVLVSWVSFQRDEGQPRVTTYLNPKAFAARWGWQEDPAPPFWPSPRAPA